MFRTQRRHAVPAYYLGAVLVSTVLLMPDAAAWAQACITCRTEKCPNKSSLPDWCGNGADPLARPTRKEAPSRKSVPIRKQAEPVRVGRDVRIESSPRGAKVRIDGTEVPAVTPLQMPLTEGWHKFEFVVDGYEPAQISANIAQDGQVVTATLQKPRPAQQAEPPSAIEEPTATKNPVSPRPAPMPAAPPPPTPPDPAATGRKLLIGGSVVAGVGIVGFLAGAGFYAVASGAATDVKASFDEFEKLQYATTVRQMDTAATVSVIVGSALAGTGAILIGLGAHKYRAARREKSPVGAAILPTSAGASFVLGGSF